MAPRIAKTIPPSISANGNPPGMPGSDSSFLTSTGDPPGPPRSASRAPLDDGRPSSIATATRRPRARSLPPAEDRRAAPRSAALPSLARGGPRGVRQERRRHGRPPPRQQQQRDRLRLPRAKPEVLHLRARHHRLRVEEVARVPLERGAGAREPRG